ncbi:hypothetical protein ACFYKT_18150 [Cytobacillus sp. FJAT-53684]|uniref:Recombinase domain-containing protein n=1 Tax=Cytobacillus mangrovibacter TaxID=3299024 RepID=A0ABW6K250_9BACI
MNNGNEAGKREWENVRYQQVIHKIGRSKRKSGRKGWTNYIQLQRMVKGREDKREKGWSGERDCPRIFMAEQSRR